MAPSPSRRVMIASVAPQNRTAAFTTASSTAIAAGSPPDNTKSVIEWREVLEGVKEQRAAACRKESALPPPVPAARIEIGEN